MCVPNKRLLPLTATNGQILAFNAAKNRWEATDNTGGGGPGFDPDADQTINGNYQYTRPVKMALYADEVTAPAGGMAYYTPAPGVEGKYFEAIDSSIYYDYSGVTHDRTITIPDASGTLAYTSNLTNVVKLSAPLDGTKRNLTDYAGNNLPIKVTSTGASIDNLLVPYGGVLSNFDFTVTAKASIGTLHFGGASSFYINADELAIPTKDYVLTAKSFQFNFDNSATGGIGIGAAPISGSKLKVQGGISQSSAYFSNSGGTAINEIDSTGLYTSTVTGKTANQYFGAISIINNTPASNNSQQFTGSIFMMGNAYKTTPGASQQVGWRITGTPIQSASGTQRLIFSSTLDGGSTYTDMFSIYGDSSGTSVIKSKMSLEQDVTLGNTVLAWNAGTQLRGATSGILRISNSAGNDFDRLQLGSATNASPAIKKNGASIQARLADDSAFAFIQGKLQADTNQVLSGGDLICNGYLVAYDAAGTACKLMTTA